MQIQTLGNSGLAILALGLASSLLIHSAVAQGVTFFDAAEL